MFIDAKLIKGKVYVSERDAAGKRSIRTFSPPYMYYYLDENGPFRSIHGDKLKRTRFTNRKDYEAARDTMLARGKRLFESDINPVFRLLEEKYPDDDKPTLNISVLDIEVDKDPKRGYARVATPYAEITAITVHNKWENQFYTLVVPPPNLSMEEAQALLDGRTRQENGKIVHEASSDEYGELSEEHGYYLVPDERTLLETFLALIMDADVLTGWNSEWFDIPYIIQRIRMMFGGETIEDLNRRGGTPWDAYVPREEAIPYLMALNLFPALPSLNYVDHFGAEEMTYQLCGRVHLDYMALYRKFIMEELHSYTLDFVLKKEVNQSKIAYDGSLDQLYRNDFRTFVAYNRKDVSGLSALDDKRRMIDLANTMAHMAGVTLDKVTGSVAIIEQAILRALHRTGLVCFDKVSRESGLPVPGAFVVPPLKGIHEWICSYDFNSLYPTTIRLINISPEVLIGQFDLDRTAKLWNHHLETLGSASSAWGEFSGVLEYHDIMDETDEVLTLRIEGDDQPLELPGKEWKRVLRENNWSVSANGTVFDLSREGIVTQCMTNWYNERVQYQKKAKGLKDKIAAATDPDEKKKLEDEFTYYDMLQQTKKLFLNSTYGAYLNEHFRFYDPRLGASVTLSGRIMVKHMVRTVSKNLTGEYDFDRRAIVAGDTDSCYASMSWYMKENNIPLEAKHAIKLADEIGEKTNATMPGFLSSAFMIPEERGKIVKAGREVVASRGLFKDGKKRYALWVIDKEGKPENKMKIMGMETRRSDTPKFIQEFLEEALIRLVRDNQSYSEIRAFVDDFRKKFREREPWRIGSPGRVKNLLTNERKQKTFEGRLDRGVHGDKKPQMHFTVKASVNTNQMIAKFDEHRWDTIHDGDKVEVIYLKKTPDNQMDCVAIKVGETYVPEWFQNLPFDTAKMEAKLLDRKLHNVMGEVLDWDFTPPKTYLDEIATIDTSFYD